MWENLMKFTAKVAFLSTILLAVSAITVEAQQMRIAKHDPAPAPLSLPVDPKCSKCQGKMESGFVSAEWVSGQLRGGLRGFHKPIIKERRRISAYCCTNCGYIELYSR